MAWAAVACMPVMLARAGGMAVKAAAVAWAEAKVVRAMGVAMAALLSEAVKVAVGAMAGV